MALPAHIVPVVMDGFFSRAPSGLVASQSGVVGRRSSQTETAVAFAREMADGFPHDEVVRPEFLVRVVGRAVFEEGVVPKVEIDGAGDGRALVAGE